MSRWFPVVGFDAYEVSDSGLVRRTAPGRGARAGHVLKPDGSGRGYMRVFLRKDGRYFTCLVHRLVLEAFVGPCPPGYETNHGNGQKADNTLANLEYVTPSQNLQHAWDTGLMPRTRRHYKKVLQTHCRRDHEFTPANTYIRPRGGKRACRICMAEQRKRWAAANPELVKSYWQKRRAKP